MFEKKFLLCCLERLRGQVHCLPDVVLVIEDELKEGLGYGWLAAVLADIEPRQVDEGP